jgi:hypothetical protein
MPHGNNPDGFSLDAIKKSIGRDDQFTVWKVRKFRDDPARPGILFEPAQNRFCALTKAEGSRRIVLSNII